MSSLCGRFCFAFWGNERGGTHNTRLLFFQYLRIVAHNWKLWRRENDKEDAMLVMQLDGATCHNMENLLVSKNGS